MQSKFKHATDIEHGDFITMENPITTGKFMYTNDTLCPNKNGRSHALVSLDGGHVFRWFETREDLADYVNRHTYQVFSGQRHQLEIVSK